MAQGYRSRRIRSKKHLRWHGRLWPVWLCMVLLLGTLWMCAATFSSLATAYAASPAPSPTPTITPQPYWDPGVIFEQRNYLISITSTGDIIMTESWAVRFKEGDLPLIGASFSLESSHVTGIDVASSDNDTDTQPKDAQASSSPDPEGNYQARARWHFSQTTPGVRYFSVTYIVHGALGMSSKDAWFDWQLLGDVFDRDTVIESSAMSVTLPGAFNAQSVRFNVVDQDQPSITTSIAANGPLTASATHLTTAHSLEMEVVFPRNLLTARIQRPHWQKTNNPPGISMPEKVFSQEQVSFEAPPPFIGDPIPQTNSPLYVSILVCLWGMGALFCLLTLYYIVTNIAGSIQARQRKAARDNHLQSP